MDRQIVYPGGIPLDTDILNIERSVMVTLGYLAQAVLGTSTVADGLSCNPTLPASMSVTVDPVASRSLAWWTRSLLVLCQQRPANRFSAWLSISRLQVFLWPRPAALARQSTTSSKPACWNRTGRRSFCPIIMLQIQTSLIVAQGTPGRLRTRRGLQQVQLQLKAGAPGPTGTQQTPTVDAGWAGLYVITVGSGQTSVTAGNIVTLPSAPFINWKLPQQTPGTRNLASFTPISQGDWAAPAGISVVRLRIWAGWRSRRLGCFRRRRWRRGRWILRRLLLRCYWPKLFCHRRNGGVGSGQCWR